MPKHNHTQTTTNSTTIWYINICHLANKLSLLESFLNKYNIDILIISEARLSATRVIEIPNYQCARFDIPLNCAGLVCLVRAGIAFKTKSMNSIENQDCVQLDININQVNLTIALSYISPSRTVDLVFFESFCDSDITMGDFNAKHLVFGCKETNPSGEVLSDFVTTNNFLLLNDDFPPFFTHTLNTQKFLT